MGRFWPGVRIGNYRRAPWGEAGGERWRADVQEPDPRGCLGLLSGAERTYSPPRAVVRSGDGWFWADTCGAVERGLHWDAERGLEQHERRLAAGKGGI